MSRLPADEALRRFAAARVAVLATVSADGTPHQVPVTFVVVGDTVLSAVDSKPKSARPLRRHLNIQADPRVSLLVQHWDEDWTRLWWVRADGVAIVSDAAASLERVLPALRSKYRQYRDVELHGPVIKVTVHRWTGWAATS